MHPFAIIALTAAAGAAAAWVGKTVTRHGYESADYEVLRSDGDVELRRYASQVLASTEMPDDRRDRGSFRRLFRYIQGENRAGQKISMTTPVFIAPAGASGERGSMAFVMPREMAQTGAPQASGDAVRVQREQARTVASLRFRGYRDPRAIAEAERTLRDWVAAEGLQPDGAVRLAYYDPPWTPELLRRNEIHLPVRAP
ncbi:MAG: heme-binding protein [Myxococcales bacterium]|jgi:hypothetical protein